MDSLKDLTSFLKTKENGASMSELKEVFSNEVELKEFIKSGIDLELIFKEGEKRGTRYYASGTKVLEKSEKKQKIKEEETSYENSLDHKDMNVYLNSDKPIPGMGVFSKLEKFGERTNSNFKAFLSSGSILKQNYVMYSKEQNKNIIIEQSEHKQNNRIALRREGRKFILIYYATGEREEEEFVNYKEFREALRAKLL